MAAADLRMGTMGWSYEDWRGPFYPAGLPAARMLAQYARIFGTVELDTTFYGVPRPATVAGWAAQVPEDFLFSAKVPRAVTHERRLAGAAESALDFARVLYDNLGPRLGALLLQLPPDLAVDERPTLDAFLADVIGARDAPAAHLPWVVEFRHASWAETDIAADLARQRVACATTDRLDVGGELAYVRLLGADNAMPRFHETQLDRSAEIAAWAERIAAACAPAQQQQQQGGSSARLLVYVRNFFQGHAPATLFALREKLGLPPILPPGKQQMSLF